MPPRKRKRGPHDASRKHKRHQQNHNFLRHVKKKSRNQAQNRLPCAKGNPWLFFGAFAYIITRRKSEKHFPGSLSEFSNNQYAYDTFPESA
eukprot:COSAG03_NODE_6803_length_1003_cov_1.837389_1_plen_90_part_01